MDGAYSLTFIMRVISFLYIVMVGAIYCWPLSIAHVMQIQREKWERVKNIPHSQQRKEVRVVKEARKKEAEIQRAWNTQWGGMTHI